MLYLDDFPVKGQPPRGVQDALGKNAEPGLELVDGGVRPFDRARDAHRVRSCRLGGAAAARLRAQCLVPPALATIVS